MSRISNDAPLVCIWKSTEDPYMPNCHETFCNQINYLSEGTLKENKYKYCPYCGGKIIEVNPNGKDTA